MAARSFLMRQSPHSSRRRAESRETSALVSLRSAARCSRCGEDVHCGSLQGESRTRRSVREFGLCAIHREREVDVLHAARGLLDILRRSDLRIADKLAGHIQHGCGRGRRTPSSLRSPSRASETFLTSLRWRSLISAMDAGRDDGFGHGGSFCGGWGLNEGRESLHQRSLVLALGLP